MISLAISFNFIVVAVLQITKKLIILVDTNIKGHFNEGLHV